MLNWIWKVHFCNVKYFPLKLDIQHKKAWFYPSKTCGQKSARPSELETPHTHTARQNAERECPISDMKPKLKTWVPGSKHHAPTRNKASMLTWKQDMTGVSGLCHKPMNDTRPKWQNPDRKWTRKKWLEGKIWMNYSYLKDQEHVLRK